MESSNAGVDCRLHAVWRSTSDPKLTVIRQYGVEHHKALEKRITVACAATRRRSSARLPTSSVLDLASLGAYRK